MRGIRPASPALHPAPFHADNDAALMEYTTIGSMRVSKVCAGTMTWGSFVDNEEEAHRQLDAYVRLGVNFIDTAELYPVAWNYGKTTERWIGSWLKARLDQGAIKRGDIHIASKWNMARVGGTGNSHGYDTDMLRASCLASIERLQCSYIDLYYLHWPSRDTPLFGCSSFHPDGAHRPTPFADRGEASAFEAQVLAVKALLDAGLIKHWGVSNESGFGLTMFCVTADRLGVPRPAACENEYSLVNRSYEVDVWEAAYRFGVAGVPYGVLSGGTLTGKYTATSHGRRRSLRPLRPLRPQLPRGLQLRTARSRSRRLGTSSGPSSSRGTTRRSCCRRPSSTRSWRAATASRRPSWRWRG